MLRVLGWDESDTNLQLASVVATLRKSLSWPLVDEPKEAWRIRWAGAFTLRPGQVITDAKTDRVLGIHILGPRASDLIAEAVAIMEYRGSAEDIARMVHAHPTLTESVGEAARAAWLGTTIHA